MIFINRFSVFGFLKYFFSESSLSADIEPNKQAKNSAKEREVNMIVEIAESDQVIKHYRKGADSSHNPCLFEIL